MTKIPVVLCWCCKPNQMYFMQSNPCTWPNCLNGHRPNPNESKDESKDDETKEESNEDS